MIVFCNSTTFQLQEALYDMFVKSSGMAKYKFRYTRSNGFSGAKAYMWYVECLKNGYDAVDRTFYDAVTVWYGKYGTFKP